MSRPLHVVHCEGWDPVRRCVAGRLTAATARERDRRGEQHAAALVEPGTGAVVAVLEIAWGRDFARCWYLDDLGRRHAVEEFRRLDGRLFVLRSEKWDYTDPGQPEFDEQRARHVELRFSPGGTVKQTTRTHGLAGGSRESTVRAPVDEMYLDVPRFAEWGPLLKLDAELVAQPDPEVEEVVDPPWRPVAPLQAEGLDLAFEPGLRRVLPGSGALVVTEVRAGGRLRLTGGRLVVADPAWLSEDLEPFTATVPPGEHRVELAVVRFADDPDHRRVAAARVVVSTEPVVSWELALTAGQDPLLLGDGEFYGFGVDAGLGCFADADAVGALRQVLDDSYDDLVAGLPAGQAVEVRDPASGAGLVAFRGGWGDGAYPTWVGRTATGEVACFVADLLVLRGAAVVRPTVVRPAGT